VKKNIKTNCKNVKCFLCENEGINAKIFSKNDEIKMKIGAIFLCDNCFESLKDDDENELAKIILNSKNGVTINFTRKRYSALKKLLNSETKSAE
jgi:hypothetical protein